MDTDATSFVTTLARPATAEDGRIVVAEPAKLLPWLALKIGDECLHVLTVLPDGAAVTRGFGGTVATAHDRDAEVCIIGTAYPDAPTFDIVGINPLRTAPRTLAVEGALDVGAHYRLGHGEVVRVLRQVGERTYEVGLPDVPDPRGRGIFAEEERATVAEQDAASAALDSALPRAIRREALHRVLTDPRVQGVEGRVVYWLPAPMWDVRVILRLDGAPLIECRHPDFDGALDEACRIARRVLDHPAQFCHLPPPPAASWDHNSLFDDPQDEDDDE